MSIINEIKQEIKMAMKEKNTIKKDVLKLILGKSEELAKEKIIKEKGDLSNIEISDEVVITALNKELKQLTQTKTILEENNKIDSSLYKETILKLEIVKSYLPKQMTEEELTQKIKEIINSIGDKNNRGLIMKTVMQELKGKADGKLINQKVQEILKKISL